MLAEIMFMWRHGVLLIMEKATAVLSGASQGALVEALKSELGDPQFQNDRTVIFAVEKHYLRIESDLMRVVLADFSAATKCDIQVLVGGGKKGILGISWRAESDDLQETITKLWQICTAKGWQFTRTDQADSEAPT